MVSSDRSPFTTDRPSCATRLLVVSESPWPSVLIEDPQVIAGLDEPAVGFRTLPGTIRERGRLRTVSRDRFRGYGKQRHVLAAPAWSYFWETRGLGRRFGILGGRRRIFVCCLRILGNRCQVGYGLTGAGPVGAGGTSALGSSSSEFPRRSNSSQYSREVRPKVARTARRKFTNTGRAMPITCSRVIWTFCRAFERGVGFHGLLGRLVDGWLQHREQGSCPRLGLLGFEIGLELFGVPNQIVGRGIGRCCGRGEADFVAG